MEFIELFAGIGGFRYGLESCNNRHKATGEGKDLHRQKPNPAKDTTQRTFTCVYSNEWNKYAASIYRRHYGEIDTRDITTVPSGDLPAFDLLTAGFPCQAFSVAGKRGGFDDTRGTLFFEVARILRDKRPRYFLLENVKGLLSHDSGKTFHTILGVLTDLGYRVEWMVLNSVHFGVPQNRERVFIVGYTGERGGRKVFPVRGSAGTPLRELTVNIKEAGIVVQDGKAIKKKQANTLDSNYYKGLDNHQQRTGVTDGLRIRRLTPTECERLMGFPDGWTEYGMEGGELVEISDTQRYKALGNAVTTNVIAAIGQRLLEFDSQA
jgi:DNA (cytosine-5)-methyltransferase 1